MTDFNPKQKEYLSQSFKSLNLSFKKINPILTGTDFTEATNYNIDIYFNEIKRAKFSRYEAVRLLNSLGIELVD